MGIRIGWLVGLLALLMVAGAEARTVQVLALFGDQAVVRVDGKRHRLRVGEARDGVRLLAVLPAGARLEIDGEVREVRLGDVARRIGGKARAAKRGEAAEVVIWRDSAGMYRTAGSINGMPVGFLVDTGATWVAISAQEARRLGIDYRVEGEPGSAVTASGISRAYLVTLDRVTVGGLTLRNVKAAVLPGNLPHIPLLGMSFLGRLHMENDGRSLRLRKKY